jgi:cytochrome c6
MEKEENGMKRVAILSVVVVAVLALAVAGIAKEAEKKSGADLFKQHCAACHPDGKNIINPKKTLSKKDMEANKVKSAEDIVKLMRNPGPGMVKFDDKTISEKDGKAIAEYILKTFK